MTIFYNNMKRLFRDKLSFIFMLLVPVFFIAMSMVAFNFGGGFMAVGIVDKDNTEFTQVIKDNLKDKASVYDIDEGEIKKKLIESKVDCAIMINEGFTKDIIQGKDAKLKLYGLKETDASIPVKFYIDSFVRAAKNIAKASNEDSNKFYEGLNYYSNGRFSTEYKDIDMIKSKRDSTVMALGFLVLGMLLLVNNASSLILEDKSLRTFYRIFSAPITVKSYMIQNILSFFALAVIQIIAIFSIMIFIFNADFGPSIFNMFILFLIFAVVCISLGVAIASVSKDMGQAGTISSLIITPICMLGGCFWPRDIMPDVLKSISNFVPTTWVLKGAEKLILGNGLNQILGEISILVLFSVVFFLIGSWKRTDVVK